MLSQDQINPLVKAAEYAVRGELAVRAEELKTELAKHPEKFHFKEVINANIGNPHQLDQEPTTFYRQVLSLVQNPHLFKEPPPSYPSDVFERASVLLKDAKSVGAYSASKGLKVSRRSIANYIAQRDGLETNAHDIIMCAGASQGVSRLLQLVATGPDVGILIPIPQYPLYSATIKLNNLKQVEYYLNEEDNWSMYPKEIESAIEQAKKDGIDCRVLVVVNPGNPTGSVLSVENIREVIQLALKHDLVLLADEVYQDNVYKGAGFVSFRRVREDLIKEDERYKEIQLVSLHTTSKGLTGECGQRGGYMEIVGLPHHAIDQLYKLASIDLCPVVSGQMLCELMANPPVKGEPSYETYRKESDAIYQTLHDRAHMLFEAFQELEGVECQEPQGAMYLFPRLHLPDKAIEEAKRQNRLPDELYCLELLNEQGICVVPGSGFGQREGTYHFRTTFLAPGGRDFANRFIDFHKGFMKRYS